VVDGGQGPGGSAGQVLFYHRSDPSAVREAPGWVGGWGWGCKSRRGRALLSAQTGAKNRIWLWPSSALPKYLKGDTCVTVQRGVCLLVTPPPPYHSWWVQKVLVCRADCGRSGGWGGVGWGGEAGLAVLSNSLNTLSVMVCVVEMIRIWRQCG
jgi:hypothetical protein